MMPIMTGPDAYAQIAALRPHLPVIFTTGYATEATSLDWVKEKQFPIVQKPYRLKQLSIVIRGALDRASPA
jgi:DNA-binding NtrC family response regulator